MQYDWSEYKLKFGLEEVKVYGRQLICRFSDMPPKFVKL